MAQAWEESITPVLSWSPSRSSADSDSPRMAEGEACGNGMVAVHEGVEQDLQLQHGLVVSNVARSNSSRSQQSDLSDSAESESEDESEVGDANYVEREYTGSFEGPEKTLEVCFKPGIGHERGCRALTRSQLDSICRRAKCTILSSISNDHLDAYVLSESSLFVYRSKILIKTCGTTTLLRCIPCLLKHAGRGLGMQLEWVGYSRKNYTFPGDQLWPHSNFEQELHYLKSHEHLSSRLDGGGYLLGPMTGDHWFVYVADKCDRPDFTATDRTINIMMFDLQAEAAQHFIKEDGCEKTARDMTIQSGIADLVPGSKIDDCAFDPCGYSMNAIQFDSYYTIHVTPEEGCSYASFETNNPYKSYSSILCNVLRVFRPARFVATMMADEAGLKTIVESPFDVPQLPLPGLGMYRRTSICSTKVEGDCCLLMANFNLEVRPSGMLRRERSISIAT
jgi:S-adenosylmethionine decarboxylase